MPLRVLLVCTGNTCRSAMAEALMRELVASRGLDDRIAVRSAGTGALTGDLASDGALTVLAERRVDLNGHRASRLSTELVEASDLVLTMTRRHRDAVLSLAPTAADRTYLLKEYAGGEPADIVDPFGQPVDIYRACADEIAAVLPAVIDRLIAQSPHKGAPTMRVAIGCDHAGLELKSHISGLLAELGMEVRDYGTNTPDSVDYPDIARPLSEAVARGDYDRGILICGTGIGMSITANKVRGIRAALCHDTFSARATREHNNTNVLCMGARVIGAGLAADIARLWLTTEFAGGRHGRRLAKIENIENGVC